ncbi:MAG TPA: cytochrome c-type biogenesis protein CcmH [Solirubrobacteraceae bacterium]|nr:cytochrome c-type biogenesis protein CcmH [Solirubrobacteraceae bacterium]
MRRIALALLVLSVALPATAAAATPRTSLGDVEDAIMCPSCREPLALAQSPQAIAERAYIETLIAQGMTKAQVEAALVGQYGPAVLAKPPAHGFNLTVYILPPALLVAALAGLAVALPRWRRRAAERLAAEAGRDAPAGLAPADAARLESDLARFKG